MKRLLLSLSALALLGANPALAEDAPKKAEDTRTLEQRMPNRITHSDKDNVITLVVENDMFGGNGTDSNYSSGFRLSYLDVSTEFPSFAKNLADEMPGFDINDTSSLFYSIGQNLYTPHDITQSQQDPDDRPWAAFLYGSMGMFTVTDNHTDEIELTLGVVGPAALGEDTQKYVHRHISNSPEPKGWDNQLKNEPGVILAWQRGWPTAFSQDFAGMFFSAAPYTGVTLGNIYTYADVGINFRLGPDSERWQDTPVRVRPAMPGTGFFEIPEDKWSWYLFGGVEGRAVARNIFLDGNTFTDSHSVDKEYFVADVNSGIAVTYGQMRISYTNIFRTKEFKTQDDPELFGAISVGYRF